MAITIVSNQITRKVYKPDGLRLSPKIPSFTEFCILNILYQLAVPTLESSGMYGEAEGMVGYEMDDSGLLLWVHVDLETRPDAANTILALSGGFDIGLGDYFVMPVTGPEPTMYHAAVAAVQPYLYHAYHFANLRIPLLEDDRIQPRIYGANVFGGADANVKCQFQLGYIKTK